ncbi:LuxR family two component transcriptional regulator [Leucobacter luti]|uniref:LuxR family two component transcriptional regulator n=1 Tax=Leucobacter luti TaxID=340320 RepID=A0A4R6S669_9MICO|nr:response regulator transcription factor [Leucobacter luti]TDP95359.1 LuxR family two component transcriptional regulator [Leucobacter luti]
MNQIRVLIADDEALVRHALRIFLSQSERVEIVAEAANGVEAVEMAVALRPDVALIDIRMPLMNGIEAIQAICTQVPSAKVMAVTTFSSRPHVIAALKAGATSYILKETNPETVVRAVIDLHEGRATLSPEVTEVLVATISGIGRNNPTKPELSDRELAVLEQLALGKSNGEIAEALFVAEATVKSAVGSILRKWGLRDRTQVLIQAVREGLILIQ